MAAYGIARSHASTYELDHIVDLAAGGSSDVRNLYPEPNNDAGHFAHTSFIHNDKDAVADYSHAAICVGKVTVTRVQRAIAANWTTAVQALGLPPIPASYRG